MSISLAQNFYKETVTVAWTTGGGNFYVSTKPTISTGYLVISANSASLREIVKFTATGTDGSGDYVTITAPNRGLGGTTDQAHSIGEPVYMNLTAENLQEISDALDLKLNTSQLEIDPTLSDDSDTKIATQKATKAYTDTIAATRVATTGDETIAGVKTFSSSPIVPAPTSDLQAATKKYADDLSISGAPDAGLTTKGLVEQATSSELAAGTATGGTGASLFTDPATLLSFLRSAVVVTSGVTYTVTTDGSQRLIVLAKGNVVHTLNGPTTITAQLNYDGVQKDIVGAGSDADGATGKDAFSLMYSEVPSAGTRDITLTSNASIENVVLIVIKI